MQPFKVHILGCGCAVPTLKHSPSSQIVEVQGRMYMIDCGEGTQLNIRRSRVAFTRVCSVFISHLHGDHCLGLIGMISTFGLLGRTEPLDVFAPAEYGPMLKSQLDMFVVGLQYEVRFHAVDTTQRQVIFEDKRVTVESIPLDHRIPCCGFLFNEKPTLPHINREMIDFYGIPVSQINNIKLGADWTTDDGTVVPNSRLVFPADPVRSYAYCSDTRYMPDLHKQVEGVNLLYHETTYDKTSEDKARNYYHSTAEQAAMVARDAHVGALLMGHYSARYDDENLLFSEAKEVFDNCILSDEGMVIDVK